MKKMCSRCGELKSLEEYHTNLKTKDGHQKACSVCTNAGRRPNKSLAAQKRREVARHYVVSYWQDHPCIDCGESDPRCLTFDHIDSSTKHGNVSTLVSKGVALSTLQAEIAKCQIRCSNCHAKKTSDTLNFYTSDPKYTPIIGKRYPVGLMTASERGYTQKPIATKTCGNCGAEKSIGDFYKRKDRSNQFQSWCKTCKKNRRIHPDVKASELKHLHEVGPTRRQAAKAFLTMYLSFHPCTYCGESNPDFLLPVSIHTEKQSSAISTLINGGASPTKLQEELDFSDIYCKNCLTRRVWRR